ncbi:hypothetical protein BC332_10114 [Capsicum chinense]|nr:hypothetical protein BC332_10114 [Capsicum chinense]
MASLTMTQTNITTDQLALLALKSQIISDPSHFLDENWSPATSVYHWVGVTCGSRNQRVMSLNLSNMALAGRIPREFGNLSFLVSLDLGSNNFQGNLPQEMVRLRRLKFLDGQIPKVIGNLRELKLRGIIGCIPLSLSNASRLEALDISYNSLQGNIPKGIGNLHSMNWLAIQYNQLTGSIPLTIFNTSRIEFIAFTGNSLSGSLPNGLCNGNGFDGPIHSEIGRLSNLQQLYLGTNHFTGIIPQEIGNLANLMELWMEGNQIAGLVPISIFNISLLQILSLWKNNLSGFIPREIGNLTKMQILQLSGNKLIGYLPNCLGNITSLREIHLGSNKLSSNIPPSLGNLQDLVVLDLSSNNMVGSLPSEIGNLKAATLIDLSMNRFSNGIPREIGWLQNLVQLSLRHNKLQGSIPDSMSNMIGLEFLGLSHNNISRIIPKSLEKLQNLKHSQKWNCHFAVKVFNLQLDAAFKSFDTEQVLCSLRHRNLVKVITSCSNLDFKALVLEYMPNGSLEKYLYSHNYFLDTKQRLSIMIDLACALEYLHHGCSLPVIHCDVKPSNVLLDEDMVAHLSDFGIPKLLGEDEGYLYTKTLRTLGYIAPAYGLDGLVSTKCGVYSYGVLLLETFTRRKPDEFEGDLSLKQWVSYSLLGAVMDVVDSNLVTQTASRLQMELDVVGSIMKVVLDCCAENPARRTNMNDVVGMLQKINIQLLAC